MCKEVGDWSVLVIDCTVLEGFCNVWGDGHGAGEVECISVLFLAPIEAEKLFFRE